MSLRPKFLPKFLLPEFLWAVLVALLASSCGLKGPLYRPDEPKNDTVTPAEDAGSASKKKQGESSVPPPATDPDRPAVPPDR
jgi:predicted small lipoprotein YifL